MSPHKIGLSHLMLIKDATCSNNAAGPMPRHSAVKRFRSHISQFVKFIVHIYVPTRERIKRDASSFNSIDSELVFCCTALFYMHDRNHEFMRIFEIVIITNNLKKDFT